MEQLLDYAPLLLQGSWVTIQLALFSMSLALGLGMVAAMAKLGQSGLFRGLATLYTTLVRGIPELVLMLLLYYGGQFLLNMLGDATGWWRYLEINPMVAGVCTIGFVYGAYLTEVFRGAMLTIPVGQHEAAKAIGLSRRRTLYRITLPQLLYYALPGIGNVWQVLLKSTAVVSLIGLQDIIYFAGQAGKATREPFLFYLAVMVVFLAFTSVSNYLFERLRRYSKRGYAHAH